MSSLDAIKSGIGNLLGQTTELLDKPAAAVAAGAIGTAGVIGTGLIVAKAIKRRRKKSSKRKNARKNRRRKTRGRRSRTRRRRGRHKHRSSPRGRLRYHTHRRTKGIHYTKHGQPYVIMSSGKAKFISKRGARSSRRRKGGRY